MKTYQDITKLREIIQNAQFTRKITHAFVHCSATEPTASVQSILNYWKNVNKWLNVGYHVIVSLDNFTILEDFNWSTNGVAGYNSHSVHICYIGGGTRPLSSGKFVPKDTMNAYQEQAVRVFLEEFKRRINGIKILGHNEVANKACPSFKVKEKFADLHNN